MITHPSNTSLLTTRIPRVLEYLLERQGIVPDRERLEQSVRRLRLSGASAEQMLVAAAADAGVRLTLVRQRVADAVWQAHPECPWMAVRTGAGGEVEVLFLLEGKNGKALCFEPGRGRRPEWVATGELTAWTATASSEGGIDWLVPEPAAPLAGLRSASGQAPAKQEEIKS